MNEKTKNRNRKINGMGDKKRRNRKMNEVKRKRGKIESDEWRDMKRRNRKKEWITKKQELGKWMIRRKKRTRKMNELTRRGEIKNEWRIKRRNRKIW